MGVRASVSGIVNIYKESGYTSHDIVNIVRKLVAGKVGHTGTLDPDAEGVLPVCLGRATKIAGYITAADKEYIADVMLGAATDTQDASGAVVERRPFLGNLAEVRAAISGFVGNITQMPPMYSAVKIKGKKLYEYARQGVTIERKPRNITIYAIDLLSADLPASFKIRVKCSKGTYIRALCADLGAALGCAAHMGALLRTKSGNFGIENAVKLGVLRTAADRSGLGGHIMPIDAALHHMPKIAIADGAEKWLKNGNKIPLDFVVGAAGLADGAEYLTYDHMGALAGIYMLAATKKYIQPKVMLL